MATLQQIRNQVLLLLNEKLDDHFTANDIDSFINQGIEFSSTILEHPRTFVEIQAERGIGSYTLQTNVLMIRTAYFGDKNKQRDIINLQIMSEETLKELKRSWLDETDTNQGRPRRLILLDKRTIFIDPPPDEDRSLDGQKIIMNVIFNPGPLTSDAQIPIIPVPYHNLLQFYAAHLAYLRLQNQGMSTIMLNDFNNKIALLKPTVEKETQGGRRFQWGFDDGVNDDDVFSEIIP